MSIPCPSCGREFDSTLFAFDREIRCDCGASVSRSASIASADPALDREASGELKRGADEICRLILSSDLPEVDIDIAIANLRRRCRELYPDRTHLFDWIYESRFRRLREQFPRERGLDRQ
jgi:hypothetical protein